MRKLIAILESGEPGLLDTMIDPVALPGITYGAVLNKLKDFQWTGEPIKSERGERLDAAMTEWAITNDKDKFDKKLRDLVKFLAGILAHLLFIDWAKIGTFGEGEDEMTVTDMSEFSRLTTALDAIARSERPEPDLVDSSLLDDEATMRGEGDDGMRPLGGALDGVVIEEAAERPQVSSRTSLIIEEDGEGLLTITDGLMEVSSMEGEEAAALEGAALLEEGFAAEGVGEGEEAALPEGVIGDEEAARLRAEEEAARLRAADEETAAVAAAIAAVAAAEAEGKEVAAVGPPGVIFGHKPSRVFEHTPDGICCVSLKIYALWLYEVAENAHNWSSWLIEVIQEVRNFTRIVKGEVRNPDGSKRVLKKDEWRKFVEKIEKMIVSWRQYSQHIGSLSDRLMKTIHDKKVTCCPKCLSDNLIKDLAAANCLTEELTEAITTATYWRQWLDNMIDQTKRLTTIPVCKLQTLNRT